MKQKLICLFIFFLAFINLKAQNITNDIYQIQAQNELMGGVVTLVCAHEEYQTIPFGLADYDRQIWVNEETMYRIASVSKSVTAVAIMQLVEEGLIELDEDISLYLGFELRNPNYSLTPITTRQLLSHTSSIIDGGAYSNFLSDTYNLDPIPPLSELLSPGGNYYSTNMFNNNAPGSYFNYSNINYGIIGTIIEAISNQRFDEYVKEHILDPLEIAGSFNVNHIEDINKVAVLYRKVSGSWVAQADNYQGIQPIHGNIANYEIGSNGLRFAPQGGLRISGKDIIKIFIALSSTGSYNGVQILQAETAEMMRSEEWLFNGSNGNDYYGLFKSWGLGVHRITNTPNSDVVLSISDFMFGHPGEAYGLVSDVYMDPEQGLGLAFMTNGCGVGYEMGIQSAFYTVEEEIFNAVSNELEYANCVLSTEELSHSGIQLTYLASSHQVKLSGNLNGVVQVYSTDGHLVFEQQTSNQLLQLPQLARGIYVLMFKNESLKIAIL